MKKFLSSSILKVAVCVAFALALFAPHSAKADSINGTYRIAGGVISFDSNSITFDNSNDTASVGNSTVPGVAKNQGVTMIGTLTFSNAVGQTLFTTTNTNTGVTYSLLITALTVNSATAAGVTVSGFGIYSETGYSNTMGSFTLSTATNGSTSFTLNGKVPDTPQAPPPADTPEPSSLILLGTGLVGAAGMMMRRRRQVADEPVLG